MVRDAPDESQECAECGGEIEWEKVVWDFADDISEVEVERHGFGGFCSDCGLIVGLSLGRDAADNWGFP